MEKMSGTHKKNTSKASTPAGRLKVLTFLSLIIDLEKSGTFPSCLSQGCRLRARMGSRRPAPGLCGAGLLIWGMLLPSERSKWGLSEIKFHRSEGPRAVESSQNRSLWQSLCLTPTAASALLLSLHTCPTSCQKPRTAPIFSPSLSGSKARRVEWLFIPLTHLSAAVHLCACAPLVQRCSRARRSVALRLHLSRWH